MRMFPPVRRTRGETVLIDPRMEWLLAGDLLEEAPISPPGILVDPRAFRLMAIGNLDGEDIPEEVALAA